MADIKKLGDCTDANFPMTGEGETYHLGLKAGQAANRILTSGDVGRIDRIAKLPGFEVEFERQAPRLFKTITGKYKGVPITLIASLMGIPNMDFTVRELRAIIKGPMAMIRIGTCGTPNPHIPIGDCVHASEGGYVVLRNPDAFDASIPVEDRPEPYTLSRVIPGSPALQAALEAELVKQFGAEKVHGGLNASTDSFYSSQGRVTPFFTDRNEDVIDKMLEKYPTTVAIEMESMHLFDLARVATPGNEIHAACAAVAIAQRHSNAFLDQESKHASEYKSGVAALEALAAFDSPF